MTARVLRQREARAKGATPSDGSELYGVTLSSKSAEENVIFGPIGKEVYERTYSRLKPDGKNETWTETVKRVVEGNLALVDPEFHELHEGKRLFELIHKMDMIPAGRHLWATGVSNRQYLSNCHCAGFTRKELAEHFTFTFEELLKGGGVGSNYSNRYIEIYPPVFSKIDFHVVCDPAHPDAAEFNV